MSERFQRRVVFRYLRWRFGITDEMMRGSVDADWAAAIASAVRESELDRAAEALEAYLQTPAMLT